MYQALYRKWRPKTFDEVSGQEHITSTLKNEVRDNRISHAYLFTGSRGTGKTSCAKILSKAVNCLNPQDGNPCGECEICRAIDSGSAMDVVEMDAASNRNIDDIRDIISEVQTKPVRCKYRVYIIDEVHMLTSHSFNALLKVLEEPPAHVVFILATTEVHKILATIQSRCQRFDFHRIPPRDIADRLLFVADKEAVTLSDSGAMLIASVSDGALRDALSLLDRCLAISCEVDDAVVRKASGLADTGYLYDLSACVINKNPSKALEIIDRLYAESKDMPRLCYELTAHFRALLMIRSVRNPRDIIAFSDAEFEKAQTQADYLSVADIIYDMDVLSRAYQRMGKGTGDRTELEMALVKLCSPELDVTNEATAARITALERAVKRLSAGMAASPQPVQTAQAVQPAQEPTPEGQPAPEPQSAESTEPAAPEQPPKPEPKTAAPPPVQPAAPAPPGGNAVNMEQLYANAKPFPQWVEVVAALKPISRSIAAAFAGSAAYESGGYLLIDSSEMAFELLRQGNRRKEIRDIILDITGRQYRLGPYRKPEQKQEAQDPLAAMKQTLIENGIEVTED